MPDRSHIMIAAVSLILVCAVMAALHENHYKDRRWRHLDARVRSLETMYLEDREG